MKKTILTLCAALTVAVSCEKSFEADSTSYLSGEKAIKMVENDPEFLSSYVSGFYSWMVEPLTTYTGHDDFGFLSCNMIADFMCGDIAMCGGQHYGMYDYLHQYGGYEYVRCRQLWSQFYTLINNANSVIDFFQKGVDPEAITARGYLGQAYAVRAMSYFYLMAFFQDPVDEAGAFRTTAPGVPMVPATRDGYSTDEAAALKGRNTLADIMARIEADFAEAVKLLDGYERTSKNEIDLSVAQGLAARYYLYVQKWAEAAEMATLAEVGYDIMDANRLFAGFKDVDDAEVMWGFNHTADTYGMYASFPSHFCHDHGGYASIMYKCIDANLYSQIPDTDIRKNLWNGPEGDPTAQTAASAYPYASRKFGYDANWLQDYIYMRASEMKLIKAEAYARQNMPTEATTALKELVSKRNPQWVGAASVDEVLFQRRIELWAEGFTYHDLRRNGLGVVRKYEGTNHPTWGQIDYPAHDKTWNFQIPRSEMQNNLMLTDADQNEL